MKVAIIDPSGRFTHYDYILVRELSKICHAKLLTGTFNSEKDIIPLNDKIEHFFLRFSYRINERIRLNRRLLLIIKGIEHIKDMMNLYLYLKNKNFDIVHFQWCPIPIIDIYFIKSIKNNLKIPVLYTAHNILPHEVKKYDKLFFSKIYNLVDGIIDGIIVHSESIAAELEKLFAVPNYKIFVVEHPIFDNYHIKNLTKSQARNLLNVDLTEKIGLFFGNIESYKGLDILLEAVKLIKGRGLDFKLIVAGRCYNFMRYQKLIDEYSISENLIKMIDFIPSTLVEAIFHASDVLILPYRKIYGSGVLLTGIAFNKPCIVTNTGHLPEVINNDKHGFVVPPGDPVQLANAIYKFFNLSEDVRKKMEEEVNKLKVIFAPDVIAEKTLAVYKNVLQKS